MYLGSNREPIRAIFDTGSEKSVVLGSDCAECKLRGTYAYYDHEDEEQPGGSFVRTSQELSKITYGSAEVTGYYATDQICLQNSEATCIQNQPIFSATSQVGFPWAMAAI